MSCTSGSCARKRSTCARPRRSHAEDTIVAQSDNAIRIRRPAAAALRGADGRRYALAGTATRIGRSPDNDIVLSDAKVSRHHAVITDDGTTFLVTDLGSANGVRVRGRRIDPSAELREGDRVRIGDQEFTLETKSTSAEPLRIRSGPHRILVQNRIDNPEEHRDEPPARTTAADADHRRRRARPRRVLPHRRRARAGAAYLARRQRASVFRASHRVVEGSRHSTSGSGAKVRSSGWSPECSCC